MYSFFKDGTEALIKALYARPKYEQHCVIPKQLGCEHTEQVYVKIDFFQKTTAYGVFACGSNTSMMKAVWYAVAMGGIAGSMAYRELIEDEF